MFNEVPGADEKSSGLERRLDLVDYNQKYVYAPLKTNERKLVKRLYKEFESEIYGAAVLAYLIKTFDAKGFDFVTPTAITDSSQQYIRQNNVIMEFMEEAFDQTDVETDVVLLKDAYILCISLNFKDQLGIKRAQDLCQRMRMKSFLHNRSRYQAYLFYSFEDSRKA